MIDYEKLQTAIGQIDDDTVMALVDEVAQKGGDATRAMEACQQGMTVVGELFETGEYFIGDLIAAGELMGAAQEKLRPLLAKGAAEELGQMILCTVAGDIHDIGKNIVKAMMDTGGFEVVDLGVDVSPQTIVDTVKEKGVKIVGLSGILTLAIDSMKDTVKALQEAGLREEVKIIVGGNPVTAEVCQIVGADAWSTNPQESVKICRAWAQAS